MRAAQDSLTGRSKRPREGKGTAWEGGTRVPCLMSWPGNIPANAVDDEFIKRIDLLPTIAGRVGSALPALPIDGLDVWPLLSGQAGAKNPHDGYGCWYAQNELQAVVSGDGHWKFLLRHPRTWSRECREVTITFSGFGRQLAVQIGEMSSSVPKR